MNKNFSIAIVAVILVGGVSVWLLLSSKNNQQQNMNHQGQNNSSNVNMTTQDVVEVNIQNYKFSPANITVKKGTAVTWTNKDSIEHNVVSSTNVPAGGPPTSAPLLGKDQQFTFTYDTVGTFDYHCMSHPYMTGSVTVEE